MLLLGFCLLTALDAVAQWPRGPGNGYAQISLGRAAASQGFDSYRHLGVLGAPDNPEEYGDYAVYGYLEYGLTDELTLIASMYGKRQVVENLTESFTTSGLSDLSLQLRYTFSQLHPLVISPQVGIIVPTYYDADDSPPLGSGSVDVLAGATFGLSLYPLPAYMGMGGGIKLRGGVPQDEYVGYLEGGISPTSYVLLRGRVELTESTTNTGLSFSTLNQVQEQGYINAGPGVSMLFSPNWQLHADARWTIDGRTTARISNLIVGLAYLW